MTESKYPPQRHLEDNADKLYRVIERFPFSTVISVQEDQPFVSHIPLILDRTRGHRGVLFGHVDKYNPHVNLLEGRRAVLAIFHGPNTYITPHIYETNQLPTWNSIVVQVRGRVCRMNNKDDLIRGLVGICEYADREPGAYRLSPQDPRIDTLIDFIVGFEIEIEDIIGRFKLSQDRQPVDREKAKEELIRRTLQGERELIEAVCRE